MTHRASGVLIGLGVLAAIASCEVTDEGLRLGGYGPRIDASSPSVMPDAVSDQADSAVDASDASESADAAVEAEAPDASDIADGSGADDGSEANDGSDADDGSEANDAGPDDGSEANDGSDADDGSEANDAGPDDASEAAPPEAATVAGLRRHVIIMIGDGMQLAHEVATSRYLTGFDDALAFHAFPIRVFKTTWDVAVYDSHAAGLGVPSYSPTTFDPFVGYDPALGGAVPYPLVPDNPDQRAYLLGSAVPYSSSTATAMATGFKTDWDNLAWLPGDPPDGALETSPETLRRLYGMSIGYATTAPFPDATPGGWFAHATSRFDSLGIAHGILTQLRPDVVIGAGASGYADPADLDAVKSSGEYLTVEQAPGVDGSTSLLAAAVMANQQHRKLLGLFGGASFGHPVPIDSPGAPGFTRSSVEAPTMAAASIAALEVLSRNPNGFFLLLEQADIDLANHANDFASMVGCVHDLDRAVQAVVDFIDRPDDAVDWTNTTVIVTADHANSYLRLERRLDRGDLPTQEGTVYPDGEITYGSGSHTNELTVVYARGLGAANLTNYTRVYPGLNILDDTSIHDATLEAARR